MYAGKRGLWGAMAIVAALLLPSAGLADGGFFKSPLVEAKPVIPYQRAFISYRDGVETLIVESFLQAPKGDYGWVVPVPASPTRVEAVTPGTLATMETLVRPGFARPEGPQHVALALALAFVFLLAVTAPLRHTRRGVQAVCIHLVEAVFGFLIAALTISLLLVNGFFRSKGSADAASSPYPTVEGVTVRNLGRIGSYDVSVLSATSATGVSAWLEGNGFAVPAEAAKIVDAYTKDRWQFVAAKIAKSGEGLGSPHPLKIVFPTAQPVFPMRLTALHGTRTHLMLFVAADGGAAADGLTPSVRWSGKEPPDKQPAWSGYGSLPNRIAHPQIKPLLWPQCTLTRLLGDLEPSDMRRDIWLGVDPSATGPIKVYEPTGAWIHTRTCGALAAALAALWVSLLALGLSRNAWRAACAAALVGAVAGLATGIVVRGGLTVIPAHEGDPYADYMLPRYEDFQFRKIGPSPRGMAFEARLQGLLRTRYDSSYDGREIPWGIDIPGGLVVDKVPDGWKVTVYDQRTGAEAGVYRFRADGSSEDYRPPPKRPAPR